MDIDERHRITAIVHAWTLRAAEQIQRAGGVPDVLAKLTPELVYTMAANHIDITYMPPGTYGESSNG